MTFSTEGGAPTPTARLLSQGSGPTPTTRSANFPAGLVTRCSAVGWATRSRARGWQATIRWRGRGFLGPGEGEVIGLASFIESGSSEPPEYVPPREAVAAILPTGGTTGPPKGAMNTHRSLSVIGLQHMVAAPYSCEEPL